MRMAAMFYRRVLALVAVLIFCGLSVAPKSANASYCVWRVITTRVTVDGELAYETKEIQLLYCCPGDPRCAYASA